MATSATTVRKPRQLNARRIIERPRLFALLDASTARVRTLIAPAGYGKSTLAEQWVARDGRRHAWFTARRSSTDVAALALGLATVSTVIVPGCDERLREHLRAVPASADNADLLAEIVSEDLAAWPSDAWLVLDDYHEVARGAAAEQFVAALASASRVQLLIASRQRPSWVTARGVLYGEYFELNQTALAMDSAEAAEVLEDAKAQVASGLVALASGWPAVIGLAAVSGTDVGTDVEEVPESLYRFFAEEVYAALSEEVQRGLATLAIAPLVDHDLAERLLGVEQAGAVCAAALDVGILVDRDARLDLHPLCRAFLEERSEQLGFVPDPDSGKRCVEHYRSRREWDAAFELIVKRNLLGELELLLHDALDELLETARLSTIEAWCDRAKEAELERPVVLLARSEVALRRGRFAEAQSLAEAAGSHPESGASFRALAVAGRAAHLASREEDGLDLYRRAEAAAVTDAERRDALWGQLRSLIDLEHVDALPTLEQLEVGIGFSDAREVVRAAGHGLHLQLRFGSLDAAEADRASQLLTTVDDPLVVSSFQNVYASALVLLARYEEALEVGHDLVETAERYKLDFAAPHALCSLALAYAGRRRWKPALASAHKAIALSRVTRDANAFQLGFAVLVRILAQHGRQSAALGVEVPSLRDALASVRAEVLSSRALVLASMARVQEARALMDEVRGSTSAIEPTVLIAAVEAVCALKSRDPTKLERVQALELAAFGTGAVDLLVTTYRSNPDVLALLLKASSDRDRLATLVRRAGDSDLAAEVGQSIAVDADPKTRLTPREREIYELLLRGMDDREIARVLFISPSTAKRHAQNIYNKLGLRSRAAIAIHAALERADQATSAARAGDSRDDS